MRTPAGRCDTEITFQRRTAAKNSELGSLKYTWANLPTNPTEWAEVRDMLPSRGEQVADGIDLARRPCRIRTRCYRDDITSDMRITFGGRIVQIVAGPVELGRREGLEMVCEDWSTEGEKA